MEGRLSSQISRIVLENIPATHTFPSHLPLKFMCQPHQNRISRQFGNILTPDEMHILHIALIDELLHKGLHDTVDSHRCTCRIS